MTRESRARRNRLALSAATFIAALGPAAPGLAQPGTAPTAPAAASPVGSQAATADGRSPESLVAALYDVISGPAGHPRDWSRFRALFHSNAKLGAVREGALRWGTTEDYIARNGAALLKDGFFERELARRIERYGDVAHVFSTYAAWTRAPEGKPFARGINSIQMARENGQWRVTSLVWMAETSTDPIPAAYLGR